MSPSQRTPSGSTPSHIAVFASGGGSNLGALLTHFSAARAAAVASVALVVSDRSDAGALDRARARGVAAIVLDRHSSADAILALLQEHEIDLVVLAGWLRLVPSGVVQGFHGRMLNVHPSLLPAFGGAGMFGSRVHAAVIASGARVSGATVHFIDEEFDRGAIAAQWPVPVYPGDQPDDVAARVLRVEHLLLPLVTEAVAAGTLTLDADGRVRGHVGRPWLGAHARAERFQLAAIADADSDNTLPESDVASTVSQAAFSYDVARLFPH